MSAHFYPLEVAEIVPETAEANSIRFRIPAELRDIFAFKAGQHLTLKARSAARRFAAIIRCAPLRTSRTGW
jgi:ferredoxin-NADP reductase